MVEPVGQQSERILRIFLNCIQNKQWWGATDKSTTIEFKKKSPKVTDIIQYLVLTTLMYTVQV